MEQTNNLSLRVTAIIASAGVGKRMSQAGINKVLYPLGGKPIISYVLEALSKSGLISTAILTVQSKEVGEFESLLKKSPLNFEKCLIVHGGDERYFSVKNALEISKNDNPDLILVQDGARPFLSVELIRSCCETAKEYGAAIAAVPAKDTIKRVSRSQQVLQTLDRAELWQIQTPQVFKAALLYEAYSKTVSGVPTDDSVLVESLGHPVKVVPSYYENIKITTPDDLLFCELLLKRGKAPLNDE